MVFRTLITTLCFIGLALAYKSPVFLWGTNSPPKPSLPTVTQEEFSEIITPLIENHMIIAFEENGLKSNDFLCSKTGSSDSCYAHLKGVEQKNYYTSVENPTVALRSIATETEFRSIDKSGQLSAPIECAPGKLTFINFYDGDNEERSNVLQAHDAAIKSISENIECPTVFLYMSSPVSDVSLSRKRRSTAASTGGVYFRDGSNFFIFFTSLFINQNPIIVQTMSVRNVSATMLDVTMTTNTTTDLTFKVTLTQGYYTMVNVTYGSMMFFNNSMTAPTDFSYFCGNLTLSTPQNTTDSTVNTLKWNSLQFQAPFGTINNATFSFGDAWHCVGFFSPGILSGLFVIVLMLAITFYGVCWMMDINTMDRFDDPKGKTITINAAE